jgi:hypothetical protein
VLASNQRRLSRRFYSTLAPPELPPADQHERASRRDSGLPPSAMRPWAPDPGAVRPTDGSGTAHGRERKRPRTGPVGAVIPTAPIRIPALTCHFRRPARCRRRPRHPGLARCTGCRAHRRCAGWRRWPGPCDDRSSADRPQVGYVPAGLRFDVRGPLLPGLVRPVAVVMGHVLAEHQVQVAATEDQGPVQQLAAQGSNDALASGVHPRRPRQGGDDPQSFGLEPHRAEAVIQVHGEVAGLLHRPCRGRSCGYPGQVQPPGSVLDEHQHVQPLQQHRFHHQEVARDDRVGPGCQELPPGWPSYSSFTT